jgi:hypothetical protein
MCNLEAKIRARIKARSIAFPTCLCRPSSNASYPCLALLLLSLAFEGFNKDLDCVILTLIVTRRPVSLYVA